ncbi:hypothetical protein BsWGS_10748 [Bradybaena similaris]
MGCATSTVSPGDEDHTTGINTHMNTPNDKKHIVTNGHQNKHVDSVKTQNSSLDWNKQDIDKNGNKLNSLSQTPVPKSVAFDVTLDGLSSALGSKKRPRKLQTLEPLTVPKLTAEQLQEKQRLADEKREKLKQRKINTSQKSSRRRRELLEAREFETKLLSEQNKEVIDDIKQAELNREERLIEIKEKQRLTEERVKRGMERVKDMQSPDDDDIEVEQDAEFNAATEDSWRGIPDRTYHPTVEEHGLQKRVGQALPTVSSSTVGSYDAALKQNSMHEKVQKLQPIHNLNNNVHIMNDDFFDS